VYGRRERAGVEEPEICSRIGFRADRSAAVGSGNKKGRRVFPQSDILSVGEPTTTMDRTILIVRNGDVKVERLRVGRAGFSRIIHAVYCVAHPTVTRFPSVFDQNRSGRRVFGFFLKNKLK